MKKSRSSASSKQSIPQEVFKRTGEKPYPAKGPTKDGMQRFFEKYWHEDQLVSE